MKKIVKEDTFHEIGYTGEGRIKWEITGWGDRETLDFRVKRDKRWSDDKVEWTFDIEVPRWGRDRDKVASDFMAHKEILEVYGLALAKMEEYERRVDELEAEFQKGEAARKAEEKRKAAERQAKIDADKPVGLKLAKMICDNMVKQARETEADSKEIVFQSRGEHREHKMRCVYTYSGLTLFNLGWSRISRKSAVNYLADAWLNSVDTGDVKDDIPDARMAAFMMGGLKK